MRNLTGRMAGGHAPRRRHRAPTAVLVLVALALMIPTPGGLPPAGAQSAPAGPDWMPWTSSSAELWCSWGNPSPGGFCANYHSYPALDVGMARSTPVHAAGPGTVVESGNGCTEGNYNCYGGRGNFVAIKHPNGRWSRYLHLTTALVAPGATVAAGQIIGTSGATGSVCRGSAPCPHLHYDELDNYTTNHHVDPGPMLARHGADVVQYPQALGRSSWSATPYGTRFRNDGFELPPAPAARFRPLTPTRILDSRYGRGWSGPVEAGHPRELQVAGVGGVPATATAVVLNVTATETTAHSFLTVYPAGVPVPETSNLNFTPGITVPNLVTVRLGAGGRIAFRNGWGRTDVVGDVMGYFDESAATDSYTPLHPKRLLDSRDPTSRWDGPLGAGFDRTLVVRDVAGVPTTASAVVLNVTVTDPVVPGWMRVYPSGGSTEASTHNFDAGQTIANLVVAPVGSDGRVAFGTNVGAVDVVVDIVGYFAPTAAFGLLEAITPIRVLDSRENRGAAGPWQPQTSRAVRVAGVGSVPAHATAVIVNVTAVNASASSYVTVYPDGPRPETSSLGFAGGQIMPNLLFTRVGAGGTVQIYNHLGSVDLVADVVGYFTEG